MIRHQSLTDGQREQSKARFSELESYQDLLDGAGVSVAGSGVTAGQLFAYANGAASGNTGDAASGRASDQDKAIETALEKNANLRSVHRDFLKRLSSFYLPEAMAASSGDILAREGKGCRIRLEASVAEPDQIYVIVEIADKSATMPTSLVICDQEINCTRFNLPEIRDGIAQIIAERTSDLVRLLSDPKTEAFLK